MAVDLHHMEADHPHTVVVLLTVVVLPTEVDLIMAVSLPMVGTAEFQSMVATVALDPLTEEAVDMDTMTSANPHTEATTTASKTTRPRATLTPTQALTNNPTTNLR